MPTAEPLIFVAGDTSGFVELAVRRRGVLVNLTGAVVTATIDRSDAGQPAIVDRAVTMHDPAAGLVRIYWQAGDLVARSDPDDPGDMDTARYRLELTVDGETQPVPTELLVRPPLG